ncbi:hypothetical protein [Alicyclobacillus sp. SO9]|uniref:hypothetical protein n=1 Tax=Alicyclobacillus sp. SO9 TaxID=2665646 RepID=UPI0018E8ECAA|nr:hypothetical protein [Alicyclobacillus sp. SO9]QQE79173.1 hypothetical protein GI364_01245 [Alicyclobacillus sp. SO9]
MRKMTYEQLKARAASQLVLAERFNRELSVRRKPRSAAESRLLGKIISDRVRKAKESGELVKVGQKLKIRIK